MTTMHLQGVMMSHGPLRIHKRIEAKQVELEKLPILLGIPISSMGFVGAISLRLPNPIHFGKPRPRRWDYWDSQPASRTQPAHPQTWIECVKHGAVVFRGPRLVQIKSTPKAEANLPAMLGVAFPPIIYGGSTDELRPFFFQKACVSFLDESYPLISPSL